MNIENVEVLKNEKVSINTKIGTNILTNIAIRSMDIICAIIGIIFLAPITLVIYIINIIKKEHSKVFFVQKRIGKDGNEFKMYKFQTMIKNADEELEIYLKENEKARQEYQKNKKLTNDPRITKTGKFLRKTSLDEFPQFFNILKGEMSLVGPRPYLPREIEDMGSDYNHIIKCKPGLTGPWQISGRSHIAFDDRLKIDKEYADSKTFYSDIKILFKTVIITVKGIGAI